VSLFGKKEEEVDFTELSNMASPKKSDNTGNTSVECLTGSLAAATLNDELNSSLKIAREEPKVAKKVRFSDVNDVKKNIPRYKKRDERDRESRRISKCKKCAKVIYLSLDIYKAREMEVHPECKENVDFDNDDFKVAQSLEEPYEDVIRQLDLNFGCRKHKYYLKKAFL
jgi:hypothetical protein